MPRYIATNSITRSILWLPAIVLCEGSSVHTFLANEEVTSSAHDMGFLLGALFPSKLECRYVNRTVVSQ